MMKEKTPQEKKALSYAKDRRNTYGQNDKASRNSIPKRKAEVNRSYRKRISDTLKAVVGPIDLEVADKVEAQTRSIKRSEWKKYPDTALGGVVEKNLESRASNAGNGKTARKATRSFIETLEIESEQIESNKWIAKAKDFPSFVVTAESKARAVEKVKHIMTVAKRNELGTDIRVQIDGKFITPTLEK